ncbi:hypothetical protein AB7M74_010727 [Bradyrhizobium japonicum]
MISDKVRPHHLERKAFLYVRQSSAHQVLHNRESSALQYAMRNRLTALGDEFDAVILQGGERAGPGCLDSAPLDLSGFLPGYAERGALRFCRCVGRA